MDKQEVVDRKRVCVTGAGGFIGSCLVKNLLQLGYVVHATLRDPQNPAKNNHLLSLPGAKQRLHLFKADLLQHGSFNSAINGCDFVINLATVIDFQGDIVRPSVDGTLDIMRACKKYSKTVKRVIHTSAIVAAYPVNEDGHLKEVLDESCWTPVNYIKGKDGFAGIYAESKTLAEQAALQYGAEEEIEVVTVLVGMVGGFSLTPTIPRSVPYMFAPITGNREPYQVTLARTKLIGSVPLVHVEDVCSAHIYLMEHPSAAGRYVCCSDPVTVSQMLNFLRKRYPQIPMAFGNEEEEDEEKKVEVLISSKKLIDLGFSYKYHMEEIINDSFECATQMKFL